MLYVYCMRTYILLYDSFLGHVIKVRKGESYKDMEYTDLYSQRGKAIR